MIRSFKLATILYCTVHLGFINPLSGQDLSLDIIYGGVEDAQAILQEYLKPYANIMGANLNAGWYNTARPHKLGGIDIMASVSWAKAPSSALFYDLSKMSLNGATDNSGTTVAPTIAGNQDILPEITYTESVEIGGISHQQEIARFSVPNGTGWDFIPLPMGQICIGLPLGTDVAARFIPEIEIGETGKIGLWGVGGKHSISQWIPILKNIKIIDVSVQGGYTKVNSSAHVLVEPLAVDVDPDPDFRWKDQEVAQKIGGWTVNLIASQTLPVISFYQGIGYASSLVELLVEGHFPIHSAIIVDDHLETTYKIVENPISLKYENYNNLRLNVGARIKLAVFTLHYDFTHTLYSTHSVGLGVTFR